MRRPAMSHTAIKLIRLLNIRVGQPYLFGGAWLYLLSTIERIFCISIDTATELKPPSGMITSA